MKRRSTEMTVTDIERWKEKQEAICASDSRHGTRFTLSLNGWGAWIVRKGRRKTYCGEDAEAALNAYNALRGKEVQP